MAEEHAPEQTTSSTGEKKDFFGDVIKFLPLVSIILVALSILKQVLYYYYFNLDILSFIELNEVIVEYVNSIFYTFLIFFSAICFAFIVRPSLDKRKSSVGTKLMVKIQRGQTVFFMTIVTTMITVAYSIHYMIGYSHSFSFYQFNELTKADLTGYLAMVTVTWMLLFLPFRLIHNGWFEFDSIAIFAYAILLYLLSFAIIDGRRDSYEVKMNSTYGTTFTLSNKLYKSKVNYYYIGKTKNYVFYYNSIDKRATVYQLKDISALTISKLTIDAARDSVNNYYRKLFTRKR